MKFVDIAQLLFEAVHFHVRVGEHGAEAIFADAVGMDAHIKQHALEERRDVAVLLQFNNHKMRHFCTPLGVTVPEVDVHVNGQSFRFSHVHQGNAVEFVLHLRHQQFRGIPEFFGYKVPNFRIFQHIAEVCQRQFHPFQNCMLFAGALLDENMGFDEKKTQQYSKCREDVQYDIVFNEDNSKMITKVMLDLTNLIHRIDKQKGYDNKKHYENVYLTSKQIVKDLHEEFEEALGERRKEFLDTVLGK